MSNGYVPITITNNQSTATGTNFQQLLNINMDNYSSYLNSDLSNVYFSSDTAGANVIDSWLESGNSNTSTSTIFWVLLPNGIGANSSITIYMQIDLSGASHFNNTTTGEAPQLSGTYAEYDNGTTVFIFYDNFSGTSLSSKWTVATNATATVNNGVTVGLASGQNWYGIYTSSFTTSSAIADTYAKDNGGSNSGFDIATDGVAYEENSGHSPSIWYFNEGGTVSSSPTSGGNSSSTNPPVSGTLYLFSAVIISGSPLIQVSYTTYVSGTYSITTPTAIGLGTSAGNTAFFQWARARLVPPNNTMPSISEGSIVIPDTPTIVSTTSPIYEVMTW